MLPLTGPSFLIDQSRTERNISRMLQKCEHHGVSLRPHFKTHQSLEVGRWFRNQGIDKIAVSSFSMAKFFADDGWIDITVAFPVNLLEIDLIVALSKKVRLHILADNPDTVAFITRYAELKAGVMIEIDAGYGRSGIHVSKVSVIQELARMIEQSDHLRFEGFLSHAGNTYQARNKMEVLAVHSSMLVQLNELKSRFLISYPDIILSYGDTPTASLADDFGGIDELRPGNFVFYDLMQQRIGSCSYDDISVAMACPVVGVYPDREQVAVYGGGVHFSKEFVESEGIRNYGQMVKWNGSTWGDIVANCFLSGLSQEHGIVEISDPMLLSKLKPGDLLYFLPVHSCMTAEAMRNYCTMFI